jgi:signal transduction histidine kinase
LSSFDHQLLLERWLPFTRDLKHLYRERLGPHLHRALRIATHPVSVFVLLQGVCIAVTVLWVVWFLNQNEALQQVERVLGEKNIDHSFGIGLLIAGCILLGVLIVGLIVLFTNAQRIASLNRQQQNFLSSVTHELRSPLASLQLAFDTVRARELGREQRDQLFQYVDRDLSRLKRLVDQILLSAKLDRGMIDLQKVDEVMMKDLVEDVISRASHLDSGITSRISLSCDPELRVRTSKDGISLILGNFLENAVKYSPRGSPITITVAYRDRACQIAVSDQGFGLMPRERKKVFKMFHRSESATSRAIPGTGLGLYIVSTIAKALGGKVWADSRGRNLGSTFYLKVPDLNDRF